MMMMKNCSRTVTEEKIEETDMRWKQSLNVERDSFPVPNLSSYAAEERGQGWKDSFWVGRKGEGVLGCSKHQNSIHKTNRLKMIRNAKKCWKRGK